MMTRCYNQNRHEWNRYGGRGIEVCKRWHSFENFYADMGNRPKGMSIDRIDNNGNYEHGNCKWSTPEEQAHNTSRNVNITLGGKTLCISEWARETGISKELIRSRFNKGLSPDKCLEKL